MQDFQYNNYNYNINSNFHSNKFAYKYSKVVLKTDNDLLEILAKQYQLPIQKIKEIRKEFLLLDYNDDRRSLGLFWRGCFN